MQLTENVKLISAYPPQFGFCLLCHHLDFILLSAFNTTEINYFQNHFSFLFFFFFGAFRIKVLALSVQSSHELSEVFNLKQILYSVKSGERLSLRWLESWRTMLESSYWRRRETTMTTRTALAVTWIDLNKSSEAFLTSTSPSSGSYHSAPVQFILLLFFLFLSLFGYGSDTYVSRTLVYVQLSRYLLCFHIFISW